MMLNQILNLYSPNINYVFYLRMFICPCFECTLFQEVEMGQIKTERIIPVLQYMYWLLNVY